MRVTYDREAKALYIYLIPEEEIKKGKLFQENCDWEDVYVDSQLVDREEGDNSGPGYEDVGIEILNVDLEEITEKKVNMGFIPHQHGEPRPKNT